MRQTEKEIAGKVCGLFIMTALMACVGSALANDWPQFMGLNGDGTSSEKGLLRSWPSEGPKVLWTIPVGKGYGGAAIRDGKVYILDRVAQAQDKLRCLDLVSGKEEWNFAYEAPGAIKNEGSRSTPSVTDKLVFIIGPFGDFHCLDKATHQVIWKKNIVKEFGAKLPNW